MKKIIIIDGGPRKNFNTASMLQKFADGASSVSEDIEVKTVRLYGLSSVMPLLHYLRISQMPTDWCLVPPSISAM